jgi:hypothetical protein
MRSNCLIQEHLCERRICQHKISAPGVAMIHRLDVHGASEGTVQTENLAGSPIAARVGRTADKILAHVSAVAGGKAFRRCVLAFRVRATLPLYQACTRAN